MKYKEFHRLIRQHGWIEIRQKGSHVIYTKQGFPNVAVPNHGSKEIPEPLRLKPLQGNGNLMSYPCYGANLR